MDQHHQPSLASRYVGYLAMEALEKGGIFSVMGATSQGIFLRSGKRIVFISYGPFCSPFTITLQQKPMRLEGIEPGGIVLVKDHRIEFPGIVLVTYSIENEWIPAPFPRKVSTHEGILKRLKWAAACVLKADKDIGFGVLLGPLLGLKKFALLNSEMLSIYERLILVKQALAVGDIAQCVSFLRPLLGMGRGLTPSGDDLVAGLLLTFYRGGNTVFPSVSVHDLGERLVIEAYQRTTTLSANIIEAAAAGQADERQVAVIDTLLSGRRGIRRQLDHLIRMGHSSGIDALVGMAVGLTYQRLP